MIPTIVFDAREPDVGLASLIVDGECVAYETELFAASEGADLRGERCQPRWSMVICCLGSRLSVGDHVVPRWICRKVRERLDHTLYRSFND